MNYKNPFNIQPQKSNIILKSQTEADKPACNPPGGAVRRNKKMKVKDAPQ